MLVAWIGALSGFVAAIVATLVSGLVSFLVFWFSARSQERSELHSELLQINSLGIEYPYLEDEEFCNGWNDNRGEEEYWRYDWYCCIVFNFCERAWRHFKNREKILKFVDVGEYANTHRVWWQHLKASGKVETCYTDKEFRDFINSLIRGS